MRTRPLGVEVRHSIRKSAIEPDGDIVQRGHRSRRIDRRLLTELPPLNLTDREAAGYEHVVNRRALIVIAALLQGAASFSCHQDEPPDVSDGAPPGTGGSSGSAGTAGAGGSAGNGGSGGNAGGSGGISGGSGSGGVAGSGGAAGVGGASGSRGGFDGGPGGAAPDGGDGGPLFCADAGTDGGATPDAPATTVACATVYDVDKVTYMGPTPLTYACDGCKSTTNPVGPSSCRNPTDCGMLASGIVPRIVRDCALSCRDREPPSGTCGAADECNRQCVKNATATTIGAPGLSDECGKCYTHLAMCSIAFCLSDCVADASSMGCITCLFAAGCQVQFERCTGLDRH